MKDGRAQSCLTIALMYLGIVAAIVVAVMMVRLSGRATLPYDSAKTNPIVPPELGVTGAILKDGTSTTYRAPTLDLRREPQAIHDANLPAGPFHGEFLVTFDRGRVQYARLGAEFQGGSLIVMRGDDVLLSDYAGPDEIKLGLTRIPVRLSKRREQIKFIFKSDSDNRVKLRAMWQPEGEDEPRPLPGTGA